MTEGARPAHRTHRFEELRATKSGPGFVPVAVASLALLVRVAMLTKAVLRQTGGNVSFPVDDAFIHLALAKQIATQGIYGITAHEFTAAASSIGWPLLLAAGMKLVGVTPWLPLAFNGLFAVGLFFAVDHAVRRLAPKASIVSSFVVQLLVMLLTPMTLLVMLGMEHTAHAAATIVLVTVSARWLAEETDDAKTSLRRALPVAAWAAATTLWRYEGIFTVALVVLLSFARRRARAGALVALGGAVPVVAFGIYSLSHGAHFLPTPVLLKGRSIDLHDAKVAFDFLIGDLLDRFATESYALVVAAACAVLAFVVVLRRGFWTVNAIALVLALFTIVLHLELASVGWFYRYESYLIATGLTVACATAAGLLPPLRESWAFCRARPVTTVAALVAIVITTAPLRRRAMHASDDMPLGCRNIYEQQMQTARFLASHFADQPVAVNDIGAVAWVGNDRIVDLMGLATLPVAEAKHLRLEGRLSRSDVAHLTQGVKVAVVYDEWFVENLPPTWLRVGRWRIDGNRSCAYPTVSIYATDPETYASVIEALRAYAPSLPRGVTTEGRYADFPGDKDRLRAGDRVVVSSSNADVSGGYLIEPDGRISLRGFGPILIRGRTPDDAAEEVQRRVRSRPSPIFGTKIERILRVATRAASVHVGGAVSRSGEVAVDALTIDAAIASANPESSADPAAAWVWREGPLGLVRVARAELENGALVDGDIVVVPERHEAR